MLPPPAYITCFAGAETKDCSPHTPETGNKNRMGEGRGEVVEWGGRGGEGAGEGRGGAGRAVGGRGGVAATKQKTRQKWLPGDRVQELCESRGGRPGLSPRPNEPDGFCGRRVTLNHAHALVTVCP